MTLFEEIATSPKRGDTLKFPGGLLQYQVLGMVLYDDQDDVVSCERTTTHREEPYTRTTRIIMHRTLWADLVKFACSAEHTDLEVPLLHAPWVHGGPCDGSCLP